MPNVAYPRLEFTSLQLRWELIKDAISGEEQVKDRTTIYLPKPNATDLSPQNTARYEAYLTRAQFYNVTGRTLKGLVGTVFAKPPVAEIPKELDVLVDDVDGNGVSLDQLAERCYRDALAYGRSLLVVDYPNVADVNEGKPASVAQLKAGEIRPTILRYDPWDIINWRTSRIGGKAILSLLVISEQYVTADDGFEEEWDDEWRVYHLDANGQLEINLWIVDPDNKDEYIVRSDVETGVPMTFWPTDSAGKRLTYIPVQFIGAENNSSHPDLPPMYDIATINMGHYRNSADYEEASYITGQPTPVLAGLTASWVKDVLKGSVQLGSNAAIMLPEGGSANLLQPEANIMPKEAMEMKERQMVALGAQLVEQKTVQRTLGEASMEKAGENSVLSSIAHNVSEGIQNALTMALNTVSASGAEISYEVNDEYGISKLDPQSQMSLIALYQSDMITTEEMRDKLTESELATVTDEEYKEWLDSRPIEETAPITTPAADV